MTKDQVGFICRNHDKLQAFCDGRLQFFHSAEGWKTDTDFNFAHFALHPENYRIKPEPQLREWKPEEVPVGKMIRNLHWVHGSWGPSAILSSSPRGIQFLDQTKDKTPTLFPLDWVRDNCKWSEDGKTWLPCGVLE